MTGMFQPKGPMTAANELPGSAAPADAEVEVVGGAKRRHASISEKRRIMADADRCTQSGELGALLRREGRLLVVAEYVATSARCRRNRGDRSKPRMARYCPGARNSLRRVLARNHRPNVGAPKPRLKRIDQACPVRHHPPPLFQVLAARIGRDDPAVEQIEGGGCLAAARSRWRLRSFHEHRSKVNNSFLNLLDAKNCLLATA